MKQMRMTAVLLLMAISTIPASAANLRAREIGVTIGRFKAGEFNAITDVEGVKVGHVTIIKGEDVRTGVTAILPHGGNLMQEKVPAAMYIANGFGKMTGYSQVEELGNIETPIILTNTLSVPTAADALIDYVLSLDRNRETIRSVNPVVGETNDGYLSDIQGRHVGKSDVIEAIKLSVSGPVPEGPVGAGTGTVCFGYKGGIGSSSRVLSGEDGGFTVGVLVQTNFGGSLVICGVPIPREPAVWGDSGSGDGSCMIIVATDAPLSSRNLKRLARRAVFGLARTGGNCSNGSGEYVIAFSTARDLRIPHQEGDSPFLTNRELRNDRMTPLFEAVIEATEEAVINSLFAGRDMTGYGGHRIKALPVARVLGLLESHRALEKGCPD